MLFEIRHVTQYAYDEPVRESVMELWMQPRVAHGQNLISFSLEVEPAAQVFSYVDMWGNTVRHFDVPQPHQSLVITAASLVDTDPPPLLPAALEFSEWERLSADAVQGDCFAFLRRHGFAAPTALLQRFCDAKGISRLRALDPLRALHALNRLLYESLDYEKGVTGADSPIDLALETGRGVCQDFSHIMIAICRGWGIPARYVSGYLANRADGADRSDPLATHAWVEVYLPSLGWIGFDPTNDTLADERHVAVAVGRDYADVPPSRGVFKGDAESQLSVGVLVRQADSAPDDADALRMGAPSILAARRRARISRGGVEAIGHQQQQQQQQRFQI